MLRDIRVPAAATIVVAIAILFPPSRSVVAQTPVLPAEPVTDTGRVSLRRAAEGAVERLNTASVFQGPVAQTSPDARWARVRALASGASVEVQMADGRHVRGHVTGVSDDTLAVQTSSGPLSITRAEIGKIRVPDPARRARYGALGIGGGLVGGWLVCPHCATSNEGAPSAKYMLLGAAAGAAAFLIADRVTGSPYRTIYEAS